MKSHLRGLRVLQIAASVPFEDIPHAGGRYQLEVDRFLVREGASVVILAQHGQGVVHGIERAPREIRVLDPEVGMTTGGFADRLVFLARAANRVLRHTPLPKLHAPFIVSLVIRPDARRLIRTADIVDLQWFEMVPLLPLMRFMGRKDVRIIGTFHDVVSQRVDRQAARSGTDHEAKKLQRHARRLRRIEKWLGSRLDAAVVLSEKDAILLRESGVPGRVVRTISPHMRVADQPTPAPSARRPHGEPVVLIVGWLARRENQDAVRWMAKEIWPRVSQRLPRARLHIVGAGAPADLIDEVKRLPHARMLGYVDDLDAVYDGADCVVVPLREGAGVKFKTIEAILAGIPTVATPIGAEGVGTDADFVTVSDDPDVLAQGVVRALTDPAEREKALDAAERLRSLHTREAFVRAVRAVYSTP